MHQQFCLLEAWHALVLPPESGGQTALCALCVTERIWQRLASGTRWTVTHSNLYPNKSFKKMLTAVGCSHTRSGMQVVILVHFRNQNLQKK